MTVIVIDFFLNVIVIDIILCNWTQPWRWGIRAAALFECLTHCQCKIFFYVGLNSHLAN